MKTKLHNLNSPVKSLIALMAFFVTAFSGMAQSETFEKLYAHTDRTFYFPGETIWFKAYITEADHTPTSCSDVLYAELITPKGTVVRKLTLPVSMGASYGNFTIDDEWAGGIYNLKIYTNWLRNYGEKAYFTKKITVQKVVTPNLLLTLKFQEEAYGPDSSVTALFSAKTIKNEALASHSIRYSVATDGKTIIEDKLSTDKKGNAKLVFNLPKNITSSDVTLTVKLAYKGSTESISRGVPVVLENIDLQFMPEGGSMLTGSSNLVAFKAVNEFGKPADIEGVIMKESGELVTSFKSYHDGMGGFHITPEENDTYYARILKPYLGKTRIALPEAKKKGIRFSLIHKTDTEKQLTINSSEKSSVAIEIATATQKCYKKELILKKGKNVHSFSTKDFPVGIAKITLYKDQKIEAERLFFVNETSLMNIEVTLDKEVYETREKTIVKIKTTNADQKPITANLSISIADNKLLTFADDKQDHIISYLLLSSELKGKIYKPLFYFDREESKASKALDFVMLTHGWRNYIETTPDAKKFEYTKELEGTYHGTVTTKTGKPVFAHLMLIDSNSDRVLKFDTDANGKFTFKGRDIRNASLIAYTDDRKKVVIQLKYPQDNRPLYTPVASANNENQKNDSSKPPLNPLKGKIKQIASKQDNKGEADISVTLDEDAQSLDEVVVTAMGVSKERRALGYAIVTVSQNNVDDFSPQDLGEMLQGRSAGIQITNNSGVPGNTSKIQIRGNTSVSGLNNNPLIIIDGVPLSDKKASGGIPNIDTEEIEEINILKGTTASALYGSRAVNGVIIINTKTARFWNNSNAKSLNNSRYKNYAIEYIYNYRTQVRYSNIQEFYVPLYSEKESLQEDRTDFRPTVYWNPIVQTDAKGEASFEFYNSDAISSFKIITEGVSFNGTPGRNETTYSTKKLLYSDVKLPAYLSLNDTLRLNVKIHNASRKATTVKFNFNLSQTFKALSELTGSVKVDRESYAKVPMIVIPTEKIKKESLSISIESEKYRDFVSKEIEVVSPYFPTETSIAGSTNERYTFEVKNKVPGSLTATFNVYTDIVGDVMNGIASMLRQPYGCFEQTSSSTYPNVMILNYLREAGKSNSEIEKKALTYIKAGYKRLISFETSENGFEWFGKTPPHETLTAFGLLEFTEMKKVYPNVDEAMIKRTVDWLLSRRDGKGGFHKSKEGYDSFASSPQDVANAYIIYALSEAGIKVDLDKEYQTAFKDAIDSNDTYKLALMACTAHNLNRTEDASVLINKLLRSINEFDFAGLPVKNTITRSYGLSAQIETAAFTVLALLKSNQHEELTNKGIKFIIGSRKYGRFGSTQATCMALKALIEYTKKQKTKIITENSQILLRLNGHDITQKLQLNTNGIITITGLEEYVTEGTQRFHVEFSNPEATFPYALAVNWDSFLPDSADQCKVQIETELLQKTVSVGDIVRLDVNLKNQTSSALPMTMGIVGIPSGLSLQPWQLKELVEEEKVAYYEIFGNQLVLYWRSMNPKENIKIPLDLKAEIAGNYKAPASTGYLYYEDEKKHWIEGNRIEINE
ncbi:TonB-dependent receptor plug domain-containing protein [Flavobacteriaceae bacterium M23B6Z8]